MRHADDSLSAAGKWLMATATLAAVMMFAAFGLAVYSLYSSHEGSCNARNATLSVLSDILAQTKPTKGELAAMPAAQRHREQTFYRFTAARIAAALC